MILTTLKKECSVVQQTLKHCLSTWRGKITSKLNGWSVKILQRPAHTVFNSLFLQIAVNRMNNSRLLLPSLLSWTISWRCQMVFSLIALVLLWLGSTECKSRTLNSQLIRNISMKNVIMSRTKSTNWLKTTNIWHLLSFLSIKCAVWPLSPQHLISLHTSFAVVVF